MSDVTVLQRRVCRVDEAMKMIKKIIVGKPGLVTQFADSLLAAGGKQEALALVIENNRDHWNNRDWLAQYYRKHGTPQEAVEAQVKLLLSSPNVEKFKTLREVGKKAGDWEMVRAETLKALEREGKIGALAERAIGNRSRGAYQQAVDYLKRAKKLAERLKGGAEWQSYVQNLRLRYPTLRALQEELSKARL
jgi:tetratricopeptide (TPR) repeat protein